MMNIDRKYLDLFIFYFYLRNKADTKSDTTRHEITNQVTRCLLYVCLKYYDSTLCRCLGKFCCRFIEIHPLKFMVGTNQGPTAFKLNYHRMEAYLTQSPLFRKSMSIYTDFKYAFLVSSAFRVEPFNTLHLTEFTILSI